MIDKDGGLDEFYVLKQVPHMVIEMIYENEERKHLTYKDIDFNK